MKSTRILGIWSFENMAFQSQRPTKVVFFTQLVLLPLNAHLPHANKQSFNLSRQSPQSQLGEVKTQKLLQTF